MSDFSQIPNVQQPWWARLLGGAAGFAGEAIDQRANPPQLAALQGPGRQQAPLVGGKERNQPTPASPEELARLQDIYRQGIAQESGLAGPQQQVAPPQLPSAINPTGRGNAPQDQPGFVPTPPTPQGEFLVDAPAGAVDQQFGGPAAQGQAQVAAADKILKDKPMSDKAWGLAMSLIGLGTEQAAAGATSVSPLESIGGMITVAGGIGHIASRGGQLGGKWGKVAPYLSVVGTMLHMRGRRDSAKATREYRQDYINNVRDALKGLGRL